jgi:hypothetical protein
MPDFIILSLGLVGGIAFAFLGRWTYLNPKRFLEKFHGKGITHSRLAIGWAKLAGALWLFVAVYAILALMFGWLFERILSTGFFIAVFVPVTALITWQLLKTRIARP